MAANRRTYTPEFKQEAVRLVREEGMTLTQVGRSLGICKTLVRDWVQKADAGMAPKGSLPDGSVEEELARLRRENRILREEREILKKAAAFFAKETR
jgi:transposase